VRNDEAELPITARKDSPGLDYPQVGVWLGGLEDGKEPSTNCCHECTNKGLHIRLFVFHSWIVLGRYVAGMAGQECRGVTPKADVDTVHSG
jgi:hypothetical protein